MFNSKKTSLFETPVKSASTNGFINGFRKKSAETLSVNGALKYETTGDPFTDDISQASAYLKPRSFADISKTISTQFAIDVEKTVKMVMYMRLISRKVQLPDGEYTEDLQRGPGLRHEGIMRMIWLAIHHPDIFKSNFRLFMSIGGWRDVITMLQYDLIYNGWDNRQLDWNFIGEAIKASLMNPETTNLMRKWLPTIKSRAKCTTVEAQADNLIGKWICSILFGSKNENSGTTYKKYRVLKSQGTAHQWQQAISRQEFDKLDFSTVHGRALALMTGSKFLHNQKLVNRYTEWIKSQPVAKFKGYVHELFANLHSGTELYKKLTIDKQFDGMAKDFASKNQTNLIVVRDISSSMGQKATGSKVSCFNIAKALALLMSTTLKGTFSDHCILFHSSSRLMQWKGSTATEKWLNDNNHFVGNTNFQSVVDLFVRMREQGVPEEDFPNGIICISDGEFDPAQLGKTNVDLMRVKLRWHFSNEYAENFKVILWNLASHNHGNKFETHGETQNVFYFGGYDASIIDFIVSGTKPDGTSAKTDRDIVEVALNQEIMKYVMI